MQIEDVAGIRFAAGRAFQNQGDLTVGDGVLGKIIVNDEGIHAIFHEPFAHGGPGERGEVLVGGVVGGGSADDDGVFECAGRLEGRHGAHDVRIFLTNRDVDGVDGAEFRIFAGDADLVDLGLIDDRIDADRGLAGAAIADDEFALAATDRDHGVDGHDAGEERLVNGFARHDAGRDFFNGIIFGGGDGTFAVDGVAECIDCAAEEGFADGNGEELAGGLDFVAFFEEGDVAEDDAADFVFFEIERDANGAAGELHHLVIHDLGEAVDFGDAVGDGADLAGVLFDGLAGELGNLLFDLVEDGAHRG